MVIQVRMRTYSSMYRSGEYHQLISKLSPSLPYKPSFPAIRRLRSIYVTILVTDVHDVTGLIHGHGCRG